MKKFYVKDKYYSWLEWLTIIVLALIPLLVALPYRVNIFLSWQGAYRLYLGQVPYRDFGLPMGFGFWIIPALFFKIFGPYLITLIKAQVFINIISGLAFRSILKSLQINPPIRFLSVLVYCISFSFFNFWPWYDQSVIVFEIIGLSFVLKFIFTCSRSKWWWMILGAFFLFFSFFTKQDGGGMGLLIALALLICNSIYEKKFLPVIIFICCWILFAVIIMGPFVPYKIGYWFNHGQPPHNARLSFSDVIDLFLSGSEWLKFYLFVILLIIFWQLKKPKEFFASKNKIIFSLLTLGILAEAVIFQVTSYTPPDNNIFFQAFAFAFIFSNLEFIRQLNFGRLRIFFASVILIMLWWSGAYWKYIDRIVKRHIPSYEKVDPNEVSMHTFMLPSKDTADVNVNMTNWVFTKVPVFKKIYMPQSTADGIERLMKNPIVDHPKNLKVLNMTELTPLAVAIGYPLEKGDSIPLWYHKNVAMFEKQIQDYQQKIKGHYYDLVLYEYIPTLNNFYPFEIRDSLKIHYQQIDSFSGPRRAMYSVIEVYKRSDSTIAKNNIVNQ